MAVCCDRNVCCRYHNVLAYDHSRALITDPDDKELYINANLVKSPSTGREYLLTQGPLPTTVDDFWLMVFQYNSSVIVMLCSCVENNRSKSWQYWPVEVGHTMVLGEGGREGLELEVTQTSVEDMGHYMTRNFVLTDLVTGEKRKIKHLHYLDWPDFNVPKSPKLFLEFLQEFRESGAFLESSGPPVGREDEPAESPGHLPSVVSVHCSAGIGRSGTLILVDSVLLMASLGIEINMRKVMETLLDMRTYRMGLIQTSDQLQFSVEAIIQGLKSLEVGNGAAASPHQVQLNGKRLKDRDSEGEDEEDGQASQKTKKRKNSPTS